MTCIYVGDSHYMFHLSFNDLGQPDKILCRSQWPRILRHRSAAARLLRLWVWIPPEARMPVGECCVLSGIGVCDEHSSRGVLPTVVSRCVWLRNLVNEESLAHWGLSKKKGISWTHVNGALCSYFSVFFCYSISLGSYVCYEFVRYIH
jgi:hypothetical protein